MRKRALPFLLYTRSSDEAEKVVYVDEVGSATAMVVAAKQL